MPILGIEKSRIAAAVRKKGVACLGGNNSEAYELPIVLTDEINDLNAQMVMQGGEN